MKPLISIIIPAFNAELYIETTLKSALNQSYNNIEIIVVDDCSTDNTLKICEKFKNLDNRVHVLKTATNFGCPGGPRNYGIKHSKGEWIAFLDADDIWHRDKLKIQIDALLASKALFCSSKLKRIHDALEFDSNEEIVSAGIKKISYLSQMFNYQTPTSSVVVRSSLMFQEQFREEIEFKAREDIDCWLRIHKRIEQSIKVQDVLIGYRITKNQISGNKLGMMNKTFYCYANSHALTNKYLGLLPVLLTVSHFSRALFNKLFSLSV